MIFFIISFFAYLSFHFSNSHKQLYPLIVFCIQNNINLFLLHEVTYVPHLSQTRPFFYKLYDRLRSIAITLRNNKFNTKRKEMEILFNHSKKIFPYTIEQRGIPLPKFLFVYASQPYRDAWLVKKQNNYYTD